MFRLESISLPCKNLQSNPCLRACCDLRAYVGVEPAARSGFPGTARGGLPAAGAGKAGAGAADRPGHFGDSSRGLVGTAALGLAERSDAVAVVVSEERGSVTLIHDRQDQRLGTAAELTQHLEKLCAAPRRSSSFFHQNLGLKAAAVALAALIWAIAFFVPGTNVRTQVVPVEFSNVPAGLRISRQSATTVLVQWRGATSVFQLVNPSRLAARLDLRTCREGAHNIPVAPGTFNLPPGIRLERVTPETLSITLARQATAW